MKRKRIASGINSVVVTILVIGIVGMMYYLADRHPLRKDFTENGIQSLSDRTLKVLKGLDRDVKAIVFIQSTEPDVEMLVGDILKEYARRSKHFKYEIIDPSSRPGEAKKYAVTEYGAVLIAGDQQKKIGMNDMFKFSYNPYQQAPPEFIGEQAFTNAIHSLVAAEQKTLCFVEGHGERDIEGMENGDFGAIGKMLEGENYKIKKINLLTEKAAPGDCAMVGVLGPEKFFSKPEMDALDAYLRGGGRALFLADPATNTGVEILLYQWGVKLGNDIVIDPERFFGEDPLTPIPELKYHQITSGLRDKSLTVTLPGARSVSQAEKTPDGLDIGVLMESSGEGWGETDMETAEPKPDEGADFKGPVPMAVAASMPVAGADADKEKTEDGEESEEEESAGEKPETRIVVIGDSDFASNAFTSMEGVVKMLMGGTGNTDLFMNSVSWLAGEEEMISIRPKPVDIRPLDISGPQRLWLILISVVAVPLALVVAGGGIWFWRRSR